MTPKERRDLERICNTPLSAYRSSLKRFILCAVLGNILVAFVLFWIFKYRSPTVAQAMIFCAFLAFCYSLGAVLSWALNFKYIKMIHFLHEESSKAD